jgi:hypothetical protein
VLIEELVASGWSVVLVGAEGEALHMDELSDVPSIADELQLLISMIEQELDY